MRNKQRAKAFVFFMKSMPNLTRREKLASFLTRVLSRSALTHCAVGDGEVVLSSTLVGDSFYSQARYVMNLPNLVGVIEVDANLPLLGMDAFASMKRSSTWRSLLKWLSFGRIKTHDCVESVKLVLFYTGIYVPKHITTPAKLKRFLIAQGYIYIPFDETSV